MADSRERVPPSGVQHEIRLAGQRAVVCEVGATLRTYAVDGADILHGFEADELAPDGRGQVLAPWPNRLDAGSYEFEGVQGTAALNEPSAGNAIHGLMRWLIWEAVSETASSVSLACVLQPHPGYPWRLEMRLNYALGPAGLSVEARAANLSASAAPFGIGFHPYVSVGTATVDETLLTIPASRRLTTDNRGLPTGDAPVEGSAFDFTEARAIGSAVLDTCFTDLRRGADGRTSVELSSPGRRLTLWADRSFGYLMAFTGDTLEPDLRRRSIALEPMTCPPNALRTGTDLLRLEPGVTWRGQWGITPR